MVTFNNDKIYNSESPTDYDQVGVVNMSRINGAIPFYSFDYKWKPIKREENCNGTCL